MRNQQSEKYARWAAAAALLLTLAVVGIYARRAVLRSRADRNAPMVPATVAQESAGFSFSKVEQNQTLFTVHASRATEFKDDNRSRLVDVSIKVFGREGNRNDEIQAKACDYKPASGKFLCEGNTQIRLESARDAQQQPGRRAVIVRTTNLAFDRTTGIASTSATASFSFPAGQGSATGLSYDSRAGSFALDRGVMLQLKPQQHPQDPTITISGSRMEFSRRSSELLLEGPVRAERGEDLLTSQVMKLSLDKDLHARELDASGAVEIRSSAGGGAGVLHAQQMSLELTVDGDVSQVTAEGGVHGTRSIAGERDSFSADSIEVAAGGANFPVNKPREAVARGNVEFQTHQAGVSRTVRTSALQLEFAPEAHAKARHIEEAKTLAPGVLEVVTPDERSTLSAQNFSGHFSPDGSIHLLEARGGATLDRSEGQSSPEHLSAMEMDIHYGRSGDWEALDARGEVHFQQADHSAEAQSAQMKRTANLVRLRGSPAVSDGDSRTTAFEIEMNQATHDVTASGRVFTINYADGHAGAPSLGDGPVQISADRLEGNSVSGIASYIGNARLWQGDAMVQANSIRLQRDPQQLDASGNVLAVLPEAESSAPGKSTIWTIRAPRLSYLGSQRRIHLGTGVTAESSEGRIHSQTLDVYLNADARGKQSVGHAVAQGGVVVEQPGRKGTAERADYFAAEQKYVLSGGLPTLVDAQRGTTTGHSLTYYVANDTILVDARGGSRTLTEHRIEK